MNTLLDPVCLSMMEDVRLSIAATLRERENMIHYLAINIHQYLFSPDYNHRIQCVMGNTNVFRYYPWSHANKKKWCFPPDEYWDNDGYSCDICQMELDWFQYAFRCDCSTGSVIRANHGYCVSCIDSIMMQYNELKPFISQLLTDILDDQCIEEIVAFCVGKVIVFQEK